MGLGRVLSTAKGTKHNPRKHGRRSGKGSAPSRLHDGAQAATVSAILMGRTMVLKPHRAVHIVLRVLSIQLVLTLLRAMHVLL